MKLEYEDRFKQFSALIIQTKSLLIRAKELLSQHEAQITASLRKEHRSNKIIRALRYLENAKIEICISAPSNMLQKPSSRPRTSTVPASASK
jgi:hypothetical protein